ncbi:MAG: MaoC family dehydratase [Parcubacteria group bacterium]|nr:MaoC family dehydratase [Parcubacteria group bacterium]
MSANWGNSNVGDRESFNITITRGMVTDFASLTGDKNLLHADRVFAQEKGFDDCVAHGMLLASLFSRLVGMYFLGNDNMYLSQTAEFRKPVLVGDVVTVAGEITEKLESVSLLRIKTTITNAQGEIAVLGEAKVGDRHYGG